MLEQYIRHYDWHKPNKIPLFLIAGKDKYSFPAMVCDSIEELAKCAGVNRSTVVQGVQRFNRGGKTKYEVVWVEKGGLS